MKISYAIAALLGLVRAANPTSYFYLLPSDEDFKSYDDMQTMYYFDNLNGEAVQDFWIH